ncbi:hypothetical protein HUJ05_000291 [Dendroctonus ponderosae]|nr:hypothetical protein HUJ05_000291 [Dendroctonus ponderosae]
MTTSAYVEKTDGLSMGNPLRPLMADIFMDHLENNHIFGSDMWTIFLPSLRVSIGNQHLAYDIFRNPTQTDHLISFNSNHPFQQKLAALRCYVYELLQTPLSHTI